MAPKIAPWAFVLAVPDLERSAAYYREILGFRVEWEEASDWRLVEPGQEVAGQRVDVAQALSVQQTLDAVGVADPLLEQSLA